MRMRLPIVWSSRKIVNLPALEIFVSFSYVTFCAPSGSKYESLRFGAFMLLHERKRFALFYCDTSARKYFVLVVERAGLKTSH